MKNNLMKAAMKNRIYAFTIFMFLTFVCCNANTNKALSIQNLKCEYRVNPLGIDVHTPRLSWVLDSPQRDQKQTAYQVLVSDNEKTLINNTGNIWDSEKIMSNQTNQVTYMGIPLKSQKRYYWKVRTWDKSDKVSDWSETAWWETSFLSQKEWTAQWINDGKTNPDRDEEFYMDDPGPLFRKEFQIDKPVKKARLYVSGLGYYEARLNGNRVGDHMLDPALTSYSEKVLYSTYDVTDQLRSGSNCLGAMLGNGWYNVLPLRMWGELNLRQYMLSGRPRLIAQLI
ncbi:MAG: hypothetical protein DRI83_13280 [Bacteroidetes bacterium]|nr:MAG: hypothetical protein DRI83_13280 [Bacteroidota bacterium]